MSSINPAYLFRSGHRYGSSLLALFMLGMFLADGALSAELGGVTVTPHVVADSMRFRQPRDAALGARVQLFVKGACTVRSTDGAVDSSPRFNGKLPDELVAADEWSWHDLGQAVSIPEGALSVWCFNGKQASWGTGKTFDLSIHGREAIQVAIEDPRVWIESVTFLADDRETQPSTILLHIVNHTPNPLNTSALRLWLPKESKSYQILWPHDAIPAESALPAGDRGYLRLRVNEPLPLTYTALELETDQGALWAHLRIKPEAFDISGGWIGEKLNEEEYLKLLHRLHINTGQIQEVSGFTDNTELYTKYPIKLFNRLTPLDRWDSDEWLSRIHAVEFLGEPQFGGGRPVPPQEVFDQFLPYRTSRLATSVTHSDERTWRFYAGLSDYPHYDAYRVVAPAADHWRSYDRWEGQRISWGAPLETIGDMCRSLRELNRPMPCAYWSQGPHDGWGGGFFGNSRTRRSPTPDELRAQAMHALSTRITSLYWFNLSLKSLLKFPDTWEPIMRIGREIRMLEPLYIEGSAYEFQRFTKANGSPDWDLASIVAPEAAVLFALDTAYTADPKELVFTFGAPREAVFPFSLPGWLREPMDVFRVDGDGIREVRWSSTADGVQITDLCSRDAIYIATRQATLRGEIEARRRTAMERESRYAVDKPALEEILNGKQPEPGFSLLFDSKTFDGWEQAGNWVIEEGAFFRQSAGGPLTYIGAEVPDDFELRFEWKVSTGCNSGVYYRPGQVEYQILDNVGSPYGENARQSAASLFFCMAPRRDVTYPVGDWNTARIMCKGSVIEHWLNGERVISFDYEDPKWKWFVELLAARGGDLTGRGGRLWLQDHGQAVWFRNLRWRTIPIEEALAADPEFEPMPVSDLALAREEARVKAMLEAKSKP